MVQRPSQVAEGGSHQTHKSNQNIHFSSACCSLSFTSVFFLALSSLTAFFPCTLSPLLFCFYFLSSCVILFPFHSPFHFHFHFLTFLCFTFFPLSCLISFPCFAFFLFHFLSISSSFPFPFLIPLLSSCLTSSNLLHFFVAFWSLVSPYLLFLFFFPSQFVSVCLISFHFFWLCFVLSFPFAYLILFCFISCGFPFTFLFSFLSSHFVSSVFFLSLFPYFPLSFPFLSFPFLSFPFLSFPFLSFPFLSFCLILSYCHSFFLLVCICLFLLLSSSFLLPCITSLFSSFPLASYLSLLLFSTAVLCLVFHSTSFQEFMLHFCRCK